MSGRFQPENGADSAQALADAIALVETYGFKVSVETLLGPIGIFPSCISCELPALPTSVYCADHDSGEPPLRHPGLVDQEPWSGGIADNE